MMRKFRRKGALASVLMLMSTFVVFAAPQAAYAESCVTKSKHWSMHEKAGPNFGWVELHMQLCHNGTKVLLGATYTHTTAENDETGPGTLGGFQINLPQPKLYYFNSGSKTHDGTGGFRTNGVYKSCQILSANKYCSYSADFQLVSQFRMYKKSFKMPPKKLRKPGLFSFGGRSWYVLFKGICKNKHCAPFPRG